MDTTEPAVPEPTRRAMRKQREKEQRTTSILQAAETLFAKKGYQQTSMEEIADLAEISPGTIYFYFKNKEDLLIKLMDDLGFLVRETLGQGFDQSDYSLDGFCNVGAAFLNNFCLRYPGKMTIFFRESVGQSAEVEEHRKRIFEQATADIKRALESAGNLRPDDPRAASLAELVAVFVVGIYAQLAHHYLIWQDEPDNLSEISDQAVAFLFAGISGLLAGNPPKRVKHKETSVKKR